MSQLFHLYVDDQQILAMVQQNDDAALAYLYEKNLRMILKLVIQNSGSEADAIEILQDTLITFWENARKSNFTLRSKISTYLYGIAKNKWLHELARRKKHTSLEDVKNNPAPASPADEQIEEKELSTVVKRCMSELSPLCQQILVAFYYEGHSMQDISQMLGLANENVAKSKKYQCKKELELLVKKYWKNS
jgi:RNA polymerase sigma factor (sigma-70 family)